MGRACLIRNILARLADADLGAEGRGRTCLIWRPCSCYPAVVLFYKYPPPPRFFLPFSSFFPHREHYVPKTLSCYL